MARAPRRLTRSWVSVVYSDAGDSRPCAMSFDLPLGGVRASQASEYPVASQMADADQHRHTPRGPCYDNGVAAAQLETFTRPSGTLQDARHLRGTLSVPSVLCFTQDFAMPRGVERILPRWLKVDAHLMRPVIQLADGVAELEHFSSEVFLVARGGASGFLG